MRFISCFLFCIFSFVGYGQQTTSSVAIPNQPIIGTTPFSVLPLIRVDAENNIDTIINGKITPNNNVTTAVIVSTSPINISSALNFSNSDTVLVFSTATTQVTTSTRPIITNPILVTDGEKGDTFVSPNNKTGNPFPKKEPANKPK